MHRANKICGNQQLCQIKILKHDTTIEYYQTSNFIFFSIDII